MTLPPPPAHMHRIRRTFFERGALPPGEVPELVLQSWRRCLHRGLPADARPRLEPLPQARLREMRERNETLRRLARPELDALAAATATAGSIVLLTDAEGWVLEAEGDPGFLDRAGRVALMPGVCWHEHQAGTNAIGTALVEGRTVQILGGEHYAAAHAILSCAATPIFDPWGQPAGVLDITGEAGMPYRHAPGLVRLAVAAIEHRWFERGLPGCELLRLHPDPDLLGTAREGLLAFRGDRLVAANRIGLKLFGLDRGALGQASRQALFDDDAGDRLRRHGQLRDRRGRSLYGHIGPDGHAAAITMACPAPPPTVADPGQKAMQARPPQALPERAMALERARRVLDAGLPVLIHGETGTGKEVFARELHRLSRRAGKPFVAVNCAALPESLVEAELFGYEEGAFTGARRQGSPGLLRQADGGVLFLDEIGDMPLALQPRLLRVLQERELQPLGGGKPVRLDFALVCATHCDLPQAMANGRFRPDLYYRIAHHVIRLPALREQADRAPQVQALWQTIADGRRLHPETLAQLVEYDWPGNLRQLDACLRTLVALSEPGETIGPEWLPEELRRGRPLTRPVAAAILPSSADAAHHGNAPASACPGNGELQAMTDVAIRQAVQACGGNLSQAARRLGLHRSTLYRRLRRLRLG